MHDEHPHPLLVQIPLTVSPFIALPTPTPLPYTYRQLPSTLPPSILQPAADAPSSLPYNPNNAQDPSSSSHPSTTGASSGGYPGPNAAYIISPSNPSHTSTPDAILSSCRALQHHLNELETQARATLQKWEDRRREEDLAEKRRVAPGWLDSGVHLLVPENVTSSGGPGSRKEGTGREGQEGPLVQGNGEGGGTVETKMNGVERTHQPRPEEPRRRTSVGVRAVVERRDGVPDPSIGEELDRAFGGMNLQRT